jgi:pentatricopeptide repeat protein
LRIKPDYELALNGKGNALGKLGRHDEAMECYDKSLKIKPDYPEALFNKGTVLFGSGR